MLTLPEVLEIIHQIPESMCGKPQPEYLYNLARQAKGDGEIVEIGTCAGKSTIALAYARQEKNGPPIHTVDILEHENVVRNLEAAKVQDYVTRVVTRSSLLARQWNRPIALLWVDGDHRRNGVAADIRNWGRFVVPGGTMALHDYPGAGAGSYEVWAAAFRNVFARPQEWRVVADREVGSILVFEKLPAAAVPVGYRERLRRKRHWWRANLHWYLEELWARRAARKPESNDPGRAA